MSFGRNIAILSVVCIISSFASAHSTSLTSSAAQSIPITGTAGYGFAATYGDFDIQGIGLSLFQGLPDGPSQIGFCNVGAMCNFSFTLNVSAAGFCSYCTGYSSGTYGGQMAEFLVPNLTFTGSAFYSGGDTMNVPLIVHGTITGYQLLNCQDGIDCTLGPMVFRLNISGKGIGQFSLAEGYGTIFGVGASFTGRADMTLTPEPISLILTGTGLIGILLKKRAQQSRTQTP
jgi:hypothetical protein